MTAIRTRAEWGARAELGPPMALPARRMWFHHTVTGVTDNPDADVRTVERIGVQRFGRMSYSWLHHPRTPGQVFEGAGLTVGAHTGGYNSSTFGVVLIGNYEVTPVTDAAIVDVAGLYARLVHEEHLRPDAAIDPHQLVKQTSCPGRHALGRLGELRALARDMVAGLAPVPSPPTVPAGSSFDREVAAAMDTIDVRNAHRMPVAGRHVDNLQGLLFAASQLPGLEGCNPAPAGGNPVDGTAGDGTRRAVLTFQAAAKYLGLYTGPVDGIVGAGTWHALITF